MIGWLGFGIAAVLIAGTCAAVHVKEIHRRRLKERSSAIRMLGKL